MLEEAVGLIRALWTGDVVSHRGEHYTVLGGYDDAAHMRKVVGYVHRHCRQRPSGDVSGTRWGYSLMNWGHDPTKS